MILAVLVHAANLGDREGAPLLLQALVGRFPRLIHLFAYHGYTRPLKEWIKDLLGWDVEILPKGSFHVQRHRWKVERTFGWLIRYRRLARDYESLPSSSEALIKLAAIRLCLNLRSVRT